MKRIYIAGPYSAGNVVDVLRNIGKGEDACAKLFALGINPFCPWHDKDFILRNPQGDFDVERFYEYSLAWLEVCDAVYVLNGWRDSNGTRKEIIFAERKGIPVYYQEDISIEDFADLINSEGPVRDFNTHGYGY